MKSNRKVLLVIFSVLIISVFSLTIIYAALSTVLNVTGSAQVQSAKWDIHFDNVRMNLGSYIPEKKPVIVSPNQVDFVITLDKPGDVFEFTVDVVNAGTIDAMIESVVKTPTLTPAQQKYLSYTITYADGNPVGLKQLLKANKQKTLKVNLTYKKDLNVSDLPKNPDVIHLSFQGVFSQADSSSSIGPEGSGVEIPKLVRMVKGDINNPQIGDMFAIKNERFHIYSSTPTTVTGIAEYNLYVGGSYYFVYYDYDYYVDNSELILYGKEATGLQMSEMIGWNENSDIFRGVIEFSNKTTHGANYSDYKGSVVEEHVNNYRDILTSYDAKIEEARLISYEELTGIFKCPENLGNCPKTYPWIYTTSYWTGSPDGASNVWNVDMDR